MNIHDMTKIDGSYGEGGGQVLRTSLLMSLVTGKPFKIANIRSRRKRPGLLRQHLTAVNAAAEISQAEVKGNELGSSELIFHPQNIIPGNYHFDIGSAGSCTLVLQTILPALVTAEGKSRIVIEGGTHNPFAPPYDFLVKVFLPIINKIGPNVKIELKRPGFYPAGGGKISVSVKPSKSLSKIEILERGKVLRKSARAIVANLPYKIAKRELKVAKNRMGLDDKSLNLVEETNSPGPGNVIFIEIVCDKITEIFAGFGSKGIRAEDVAESAVIDAKEYVRAKVPVGKYLADQLLIPMVLAGGGKFRTLLLTEHTKTNVEIIKKFIDIDINVTEVDDNAVEVEVGNIK